MTRRFSVIAALSLVLCFLPGCFTLATQIDETPGPRVFSGTRVHVMGMVSGRIPTLPENYWARMAWLDLPLSLAADSLILPCMVPTQLMYGNFKETQEDSTEWDRSEALRKQQGEDFFRVPGKQGP